MASFLASATKAVSNNFGAYILLLQKEAHQQRQANLSNQREANAQTRWEAGQKQSKQQHSDNLTFKEKQLTANSDYKKEVLSQRETDKAMSMYNGYEKQANKEIAKIMSDTDKEVRELQAMGQTDQARKLAEQAEMRINSIEEQYTKAAAPFKQKLISSGYLPQENQQEVTEQPGNAPPELITQVDEASTPSVSDMLGKKTGNEPLFMRPEQSHFQESFNPSMDRLINNNRVEVNESNMSRLAKRKYEGSVRNINMQNEQAKGIQRSMYQRY